MTESADPDRLSLSMLRSADFVFRPLTPADAPACVDAVLESSATLAPWMPWAHGDYALADYGFAELPLGRIEIAVGVGNAASLGAARKAGAVEEGIARNGLKIGERFIDARILALLPPATA